MKIIQGDERMSKIRWIHFSDLHLNKTGTETKRLRKKLIDYLDSMDGKFTHSSESSPFCNCTGYISIISRSEKF